MYLKRLEIQGFKSFATRTVFEFGAGVTAVIGPNGSGKSNVSDAIRWVLGEQNPRVMRLRKAEDALFAGGQKRAPAGLAEVSLWLDNSEGWLPVAYDEVVVTRRLHRSGESEYLLNRARVRLRDVHDLFLRARVGQNSYALMGQGLVDQVLSLRPEERRALLEEAAEVRHYQVRVEEARDRLAATEDNLEKVDLIIAEIAPRLGRLERAARRAEEHARLAGELAEALVAWYGGQWREREEALVAARAAYDQHNAAFAAAVARADQLESRLAAAQGEAASATATAGEAQARRDDLAEQARAAAARRTLEAERLGFVRRRLGELDGESGQIERERADLAATLAPGGESADLAGMLATARGALDERLAALALAEREAEAARRALAEAETAERRRAADLREGEERLARLDREAAIAGRETPALLERQGQLLAHLKRIGHETLQQRRVAVLAAREVERADAARSVAVWNLEAARDALSEANRAAGERRHAVEEQSRRFELLERMRDQFARVDPGAAAVVAGAGAGGYRVLGVLGELVRVGKGMEAAVEAALAEYLNAVVLPGGRDALAALALLTERATGRGTLLPLDAIRPVAPINLAREKGVVGVAARFVRCEAELRELIDTLLGRVVIVDDLATAREMLRRGFGQVVTVDGVVLRPSGAITGGRHAAEGGRFALERDLETIPGEIERLLAEGEAAEGALVRLRGEVGERERALAEANAEVRRAEQRYAQAHTRMLAGRGHLAPVRGELVYVRGALVKLAERGEALAGEQAGLAERRTALAAALVEARGRAATARGAAREPGGRVDALRAQVAEARGALAALEREQATLAGLRASRQAALHRLDERLAGRRREAAARRAEIAQAEADAERLAAECDRLDAERDAAAAALLPARDRLARLTAALAELEPQLREGRAALADAERRALAAENDLHRRAGELDRLRDEMAADGFAPNDERGTMNDEQPALGGPRAADGEPAPANAPIETGGVRPLAVHRSAFLVHPFDAAAAGEQVRALRAEIRKLGSVDEVAPAEYAEARERHDFLRTQVADLREAETGLQEAIAGLRGTIREQFRATFIRVNEDFGRYFALFFGGGSAKLVLTEPEDYGESGVDIVARPPGKRLQSLTLLSGGERAMTAVALLFALLEANPAPFCVLDEVDAALDEANVGRFGDALRELARRSQFAVITHNRGTIGAADTIYGVSMGTDGVSTVLSLRLGDVPE